MMPEFEDEPPAPPHGTLAQPGTKHKIEVMRSRLDLGFAIFHEDDPVHQHAYNQPKRDTVSLAELRAALRDKGGEYQDDS